MDEWSDSAEMRVLQLIAQGLSNQAISERLGITKRAVEFHIGIINRICEVYGDPDVAPRVKVTLMYQRYVEHKNQRRFSEEALESVKKNHV